jgi:hypothetical protein
MQGQWQTQKQILHCAQDDNICEGEREERTTTRATAVHSPQVGEAGERLLQGV